MPLGLRARLFLASIAFIAVGLFGAQWYVSRALARDQVARVRHEFTARVDLAAEALQGAGAFAPAAADAWARRLARAGRARVTLIDPRGAVVADSSVPLAEVARLQNHGDRPEVRAARATGHGLAERDSVTLRRPQIYLARRLDGPGGAPWVVRLAIDPARLAAARAETRRFLFAGALVGLLAAAALSSLASHLLARRVRALTTTARRRLRDLSVRAPGQSHDELGELGRALDELSAGLAGSLADLQHERDRLEAILEAMAEGVLVTAADGTILLANRAVREMFLAGRDLVGRPLIDALRDADLHDAIATAERDHATVAREIAVSGVRPRRVMVRVTPLASGTQGTVAVLSDVTELRRLETVRRDFVANVSHELRTPIAAVRAAVETLQAGAVAQPEAAAEFLGIVERHAQRLQQLVEDLLDLSRIEARELALAVAPLDADAAAARAVELFRLAADQRNVRLAHAPHAGGPLVAQADPRALEQILSNLIDNAIKYSPPGASVSVAARPRGEAWVRISVQDTGPGIDARHLPRLFERFYRVDKGRSRQLGGTGLGLAIVKHLAEAMGGVASVESAVGQGTVFHVDLRAAGPAAPAGEPR